MSNYVYLSGLSEVILSIFSKTGNLNLSQLSYFFLSTAILLSRLERIQPVKFKIQCLHSRLAELLETKTNTCCFKVVSASVNLAPSLSSAGTNIPERTRQTRVTRG